MGANDTVFLHGREQIIEKATHLFNTAREEIRLYASAETLRITASDRTLQALKSSARARGVKLRFLTEITPENLGYCKNHLQKATELRHLEGLKGNFILSESEFMVSPEISSEFPLTSGSQGSHDHLLRVYRSIFETAWRHAMPAAQRMSELESPAGHGISRANVLDSVYVCVECSMIFAFDSDVTDHQARTGHKGVGRAPFG